MKNLDGYKTYIVSGIIIAVCLCAVFDVISQENAAWFVGMMIGLGLAAERHAISKSKNDL